ncbi:MAG TPA: hypothetical protein VEX86_23265 [Longimicrobium sp.]|nr:hypothetical protein [Longimicrobium sp.]
MVYGSTQTTEAAFSASHVEVPPVSSGVNANGLRTRTFFYPGLLYPINYSELPAPAGFLGKRLLELRRGLRRAFGIGTGTCLDPGAPRGSRRGRIVRLSEAIAADFRTAFAVLITEHVYSCEDRYQLLIPILRGDALRSTSGGLLVENQSWLSVFAKPTHSAVFPAHLVQSAWYTADIAGETSHVIDQSSLQRIESELCAHFELTD